MLSSYFQPFQEYMKEFLQKKHAKIVVEVGSGDPRRTRDVGDGDAGKSFVGKGIACRGQYPLAGLIRFTFAGVPVGRFVRHRRRPVLGLSVDLPDRNWTPTGAGGEIQRSPTESVPAGPDSADAPRSIYRLAERLSPLRPAPRNRHLGRRSSSRRRYPTWIRPPAWRRSTPPECHHECVHR